MKAWKGWMIYLRASYEVEMPEFRARFTWIQKATQGAASWRSGCYSSDCCVFLTLKATDSELERPDWNKDSCQRFLPKIPGFSAGLVVMVERRREDIRFRIRNWRILWYMRRRKTCWDPVGCRHHRRHWKGIRDGWEDNSVASVECYRFGSI